MLTNVHDCLFCSHHSNNMDKNLVHMSEKHSFFLPDLDFITDINGLMDYLGAKVGQGKMCLWCSEKGKAQYYQNIRIVNTNDLGVTRAIPDI